MRLKYINSWKWATHRPLCAPESAGSWLRNSIPSRPQCCQRSPSQVSAHQTSPLHKYGSVCHKRTALCSHPTVLQTSHLTLKEKNRVIRKQTMKKGNQFPNHGILKQDPLGSLPLAFPLYSRENHSMESNRTCSESPKWC